MASPRTRARPSSAKNARLQPTRPRCIGQRNGLTPQRQRDYRRTRDIASRGPPPGDRTGSAGLLRSRPEITGDRQGHARLEHGHECRRPLAFPPRYRYRPPGHHLHRLHAPPRGRARRSARLGLAPSHLGQVPDAGRQPLSGPQESHPTGLTRTPCNAATCSPRSQACRSRLPSHC
ncbi:unnamed protein product [Brugia timori]|uniref:Uncharacterized protein n=1 Tax=Brugia timori TaxID=42155 RepID=A0A0R3QFZ5_9BILA|nr:unnamed protein product [Brugia timori]